MTHNNYNDAIPHLVSIILCMHNCTLNKTLTTYRAYIIVHIANIREYIYYIMLPCTTNISISAVTALCSTVNSKTITCYSLLKVCSKFIRKTS